MEQKTTVYQRTCLWPMHEDVVRYNSNSGSGLPLPTTERLQSPGGNCWARRPSMRNEAAVGELWLWASEHPRGL